MNKTFYFISLALTLFSGLLFSSCDDDPDELIAKPSISDLEVGLENSLVGYIGGDLHIEAEIVAEGIIDKITVEIHQEEGSSEEIEMSYDEFAGLKNTTFHEHVDIPADTEEGDYHFHLTVTDKVGNQTTVEVEIRLEEIEDTDNVAHS